MASYELKELLVLNGITMVYLESGYETIDLKHNFYMGTFDNPAISDIKSGCIFTEPNYKVEKPVTVLDEKLIRWLKVSVIPSYEVDSYFNGTRVLSPSIRLKFDYDDGHGIYYTTVTVSTGDPKVFKVIAELDRMGMLDVPQSMENYNKIMSRYDPSDIQYGALGANTGPRMMKHSYLMLKETLNKVYNSITDESKLMMEILGYDG